MFEATHNMIENATSQGHGSFWMIIVLGMFFGAIFMYTRTDKFEKIAGFGLLVDTVLPKMLFLTIGLSSIGFFLLLKLGIVHYELKPVMLGGLIIGGLLFGSSMAIFGKCPGTGPVSIAEGRVDVLVGAIGGILGGWAFTYFYPHIEPLMGPNLGSFTLPSLMQEHQGLIILAFGIFMTVLSIKIPLLEYEDKED